MRPNYSPWPVTVLFPDSVDDDRWQCAVCGVITDTAYLILSQLTHPTVFASVEPVCDECAATKPLAQCVADMGIDLTVIVATDDMLQMQQSSNP